MVLFAMMDMIQSSMADYPALGLTGLLIGLNQGI
jgi:hypothetical protein